MSEVEFEEKTGIEWLEAISRIHGKILHRCLTATATMDRTYVLQEALVIIERELEDMEEGLGLEFKESRLRREGEAGL